MSCDWKLLFPEHLVNKHVAVKAVKQAPIPFKEIEVCPFLNSNVHGHYQRKNGKQMRFPVKDPNIKFGAPPSSAHFFASPVKPNPKKPKPRSRKKPSQKSKKRSAKVNMHL